MKRLLRAVLRRVFQRGASAGQDSCVQASAAEIQLTLLMQYRELAARKASLPRLQDVEFSRFSQSGEDGILLFIFAIIGMGNRRAIEISAADGIECNSANLVVNHGWTALLFEANAALVAKGRAFYSRHRATRIWPPQFVEAWVSAENVNALIESNGFAGEVDLLSLDIDGMDFWVWKALSACNPRVVVIEYQTAWGPVERKVVPYEESFRLKESAAGPIYAAGASLNALVKLARDKGYTLVGVQKFGFNAFFVRNDLLGEHLREVLPSDCFSHRHAIRCIETGRSALANYAWIDV